MNATEIIIVVLAVPAGILVATAVTVLALVRHAREKRDRQLFDAYVHHPRELETWLVRGALEHIQHALVIDDRPRESGLS